ncbi:uncharacterized protein LOC123893206 [Trifolium pratense]|uniref:Uncharacterized protein n=1 Tax=Trifolium pratense TaxID=57577 RepID=A0ACB0LRT2_TRIPR|nr:uncharacterized protein LOC123893206 [Trifolium pratense]CAJ2671213.1 unnamed protein product [Trifolium pratense]
MEEPKAPVAVAATQQTLHTQTPTTRKRPLDSNSNSNSNYFKIRALVRDLRPHFIQVLQTPDYKNCKASHEIRDQLKIVLKVYNDMKADVVSLKQLPQRFKSPEQTQVEKAFARPSVGEDSQTSGTYIIGGSAFGWNFITFSALDSVYYGRTKEQFRLQKKTE